jgi:uncharacterized BrkB/YihY/UPF0761 family membrane protein
MINWIWYEEESKTERKIINDDIEVIVMVLSVLGGSISISVLICYILTIFTPNNAVNINYFNTKLPYLWVPGVVISINAIFIAVYYKVGKRVCRIIYKE